MIVRELVTLLGFDLDEATAKKYEQRLAGMQSKAEKVVDALDRSAAKAMKNVGAAAVKLTASAVAGATAAGAAATAVFAKSIGDIEEMARGIEISGLDASTFQTWATVATDEFGWGVDKFADVMKDVNDRVGQLIGENSGELKGLVDAYGKKAGMGAQDFVGEDAVGTIAKVAEMLKRAGANQAQITAAGEALADDGSILLKMAMRENGELERKLDLARQGLMLSEDEIKAAKELQTARRRMTSWFDDVRFKISAGLAPALTALLDKWNAWLVANKELVSLRIEQAIAIGTRAIDRMASIVDKVGSAFTWVTDKLGGFENAVRTLSAFMTGALAAAGAAFLVWIAPSLPGLAAAAFLLAALGYAIQDVYTWINGGESVIGAWLGSWEDFSARIVAEWNAAWSNIKAGFANIGQAWTDLTTTLSNAWSGFTDWLGDKANALGDLIGKAWDLAKAPFVTIIDFYKELWLGLWNLLPDTVKDKATALFQPLKDAWDGAVGWIGDKWDALWGRIGGAISTVAETIRNAFSEWGAEGYNYSPDAMAEAHRKKTGQQNPIGPDGSLRPVNPKRQFADGTRSAPRGIALVGEDGPEIVRFGGGEQVIPAAPSSRMLEALAANARSFAQRAAAFGERFAADFGGMQGRMALAAGATPGHSSPNPVGGGRSVSIGDVHVSPNITINANELRPGSSPEDIARAVEGKMRGVAEDVIDRQIRAATRHFTEQE